MPITANAIIHPEHFIITSSASHKDKKTYILQMINHESKKPIYSEEVQEPVSYWKWLSSDVFCFVTVTGVYTINLIGKKEKLYSLPSKNDRSRIDWVCYG